MKILRELRSEDNTFKYLVGLDDRNSVEALYMHDREQRLTYHSTVCVSSQVGCAMGCRFCATGKEGFVRNLTTDEILGQVDICDNGRHRAGRPPIDAVVFAGMGEPLLNYPTVITSIERIREERDLCHFELATVGVVPRIYDLARYLKKGSIHMRLNLSLHAPTDEKRLALIPFTKKYGVHDILDAAAAFAEVTKSKTRIRYMLMRGINDTDEDIDALIGLLRGRPLKLIISRYNDNNIKNLRPINQLEILDFHNKIKDSIDCDLFHNFGGAIQGGCGQLRQLAQDAHG
ncbi:MAG: radical SAM protein [Clostridiales bacterium]|nr:radical SAM protein [Clostridiales bacterium]